MNRPIRTLAAGFLLLFVAVMGRATYLQFFDAASLSSVTDHPGNVRALNDEFSRQRGNIMVEGNGATRQIRIAYSQSTGGVYKYQRVYPYGAEYAQITGYFSLGYGLGGVEANRNKALSGEDDSQFLRRLSDILANKPTPGENVILTLNPAAQKAAYDGLRGKIGSVVAIEPSSGKILAMVSTPSYNPNDLARHNAGQVSAAKTRLLNQKPSPLDNTAIQTIVPPGSTFKLVTAAAALSRGYTPNSLVPGVSRMKLPLSSRYLTNENGFSCGAPRVTLTVALERSCNVAFGTVGNDLGVKALTTQAEKFGFGQTYFNELNDGLVSQSASNFPANADAPGTVLAAIGQGNVAATPLQMALVAAGIANGGTVMAPYIVNEIDASNLDVIYKASQRPINDMQPAVSPAVAQELTQMMVQVVQNGTGTTAQIPGIQVAGKTGTAQSAASRPPYAWFVSFAPADHPQVAVAVLIQDAGVDRNQISGAGLAAPIAKAVMRAVIGQ